MLECVYGVELLSSLANRNDKFDEPIRELSELAKPFDRVGELLLFGSPELPPETVEYLERSNIEYEPLTLLKLSQAERDRIRTYALFEDYAIVSNSGNVYFDLSLVAAFTIAKTKPEAEPAPALLQLEEHLIGTLETTEGSVHLMDRQLALLADRIALAYGCTTSWKA